MSSTEEVELTNMCMICDGEGNVLVQDKKSSSSWHGWNFPGGHVEKGEYVTPSVVREVKEESGLDVEIKDIIGTYTDPNIRVAYSDGEVRQEFTIVYYGEALNYDVSLDDESSQFKWLSLDKVLELPLADSQRRRINDAIEYLNSGTRKMI